MSETLSPPQPPAQTPEGEFVPQQWPMQPAPPHYGAAQQGAPYGSPPSPDQPAAARPKEILTLPPLDELEPQLPISEATGQPRRDTTMLVGMGLLYASAVASAVAYCIVWWRSIHMETYFSAARMLRFTHDRPGSWQSLMWAVLVALTALVMVTAPAVAGFQAWNGYRWSRIAAIVAAVLSFLGLLLNQVAWAAIPLAVLGAVVLWLPQVSRYFGYWEAYRAPVPKHPRDTSNVVYGPLPRYR